MFSCQKTYKDIPIAHRQSDHEGHCALIHGHNFSITFDFGCHELDASGFVLDLGDLKYIQEWIDENLDHAFLMNIHDPIKEKLLEHFSHVFKVYQLKSCSCEGLAEHVYTIFSPIITKRYQERVFINAIHVSETTKNQATYRP